MSFEDFDKRIREAADNHHPAFNENAWQNMERMLDEQLPQEDDRRRRFFFWLLFGLVLGGALLLTVIRKTAPLYSEQKTKQESASKPVNEKNNNTASAIYPQEKKTPSSDQNKNIVTNTISDPVLPDVSGKEIAANEDMISASYKVKQTATLIAEKRNDQNNTVSNEKKITSFQQNNLPGEKLNNKEDQSIQKNGTPPNTTNDQKVSNPSPNTDKEKVVAATPQNQKAAKEKIATQHDGFRNRFSINVTAGPAISAVAIDRPGKLTVSYGGGANYQVSRKISLSAGFLVSRKIYNAGAADYHPPAGYWTYNYDLKKVEADCKVYELPLAINFIIAEKARHNFFASAGLSSYIMKRERYDYLYKDPAGQTRYRGWTLKNRNEHYFSILALSGGYQYKISNRTSFIIQPVVKVPLAGVGFGKIKLADAGTYFTWQVKPFARK